MNAYSFIQIFCLRFFFRLQILKYFEGDNANCQPRSDCCDNCRQKSNILVVEYEDLDSEGRFDYGTDSVALLQVINLFNGHSGLGKPLAVIRGSKVQDVKKYHNHSLFGIGKYKSEEFWQAMAELLEQHTFLYRQRVQNQQSFPYMTIKSTQTANTWLLCGNRSLLLKPPENMLKFLRKKTPNAVASSSVVSFPSINIKRSAMDLQQALLLCRTELAGKCDVMPYMIASNSALDQLARIQPLNMNELRLAKIDGLSESKILQFGPSFLQCILKNKNLLPDNDSFKLVNIFSKFRKPNGLIIYNSLFRQEQ